MTSLAPNTCLYIKNLNDKVKKDELRAQLYSLFTPYGRVIDVVARKGSKMKGQAFVVFSDLQGATSALRAMDGEFFYDKPMHIQYGKSKSHATIRLEEGADAVPLPNRSVAVNGSGDGKVVVSRAEGEAADREREKQADADTAQGKRVRENGEGDDARLAKRTRTEENDDVEMEIEDEE